MLPFLASVLAVLCSASDLESHPGHLKPFGCCGEKAPVQEHQGLMSPGDFIVKHVETLTPVVMRGGAKQLSIFNKWTDEYLAEAGRQRDIRVHSETVKKELRPQPSQSLSLPEFLEQYNSSEKYMVDNVPVALREDVELPFPLQCDTITEYIQDVNMWMSSGGTKSVVHSDDADNLNCLLRGTKHFVLIDPKSIDMMALIDHQDGGYSGLDVDSVDFRQYPLLADAQTMNIKVQAGDCLYLPFNWVHQVRSVDSNLAVNFFFYHASLYQLELDECKEEFNRSMTVDKYTFLPSEKLLSPDDTTTVRHLFSNQVKRFGGDFEAFSFSTMTSIATFAAEDEHQYLMIMESNFRSQLTKMFKIADVDDSESIEEAEILALSDEAWKSIREVISEIVYTLSTKLKRMAQFFRQRDEL